MEEHKQYRRLVGKLRFTASERPDLGFEVLRFPHLLSQTRVCDMAALKRVKLWPGPCACRVFAGPIGPQMASYFRSHRARMLTKTVSSETDSAAASDASSAAGVQATKPIGGALSIEGGVSSAPRLRNNTGWQTLLPPS